MGNLEILLRSHREDEDEVDETGDFMSVGCIHLLSSLESDVIKTHILVAGPAAAVGVDAVVSLVTGVIGILVLASLGEVEDSSTAGATVSTVPIGPSIAVLRHVVGQAYLPGTTLRIPGLSAPIVLAPVKILSNIPHVSRRYVPLAVGGHAVVVVGRGSVESSSRHGG